MCQICDMRDRWNLNDTEVELFKDTIEFLMKTELDYLRECERKFECILMDAKERRDDTEHVGKCFLQAGEAYQAVQDATEACDDKFQDLLMRVSRPGNA